MGAPSVAAARAAAAAQSSSPAQGASPWFIPNRNAQQYPPGTWHAPRMTAPDRTNGSQTWAPLLPPGRKPGEQSDLRTATSETILNPDGTWTLKSYTAPIHYRDAKGHWQLIDNTLTANTSVAGYSYSNRAGDWHVYFAPAAGGPNLIHAQFPGATVTETLDGAAKAAVQLSGNQARYAGVFPGVDLAYQVGTLGLEEMLVLHGASGPTSYSFTYHLPGATAQVDAQGTLRFTDAKGNLLLTVGGILMYEADAQGRMTAKGALSQAVHVSLSGAAPDFHVTLTPDQGWLKDAHRHFPVVIDPTWQGGDLHTSTTSGSISADTIDESGNPTTLFYDLNSLRIGNANVISGLVGNGVSRSYLKFPIGTVPTNVHVTSADLALYQSSAYSGGGAQITASMITSAWNATTLDWNNHPTSVWGGVTSKTATNMFTWIHFDVSQYATLWWQESWALNGFRLQYANETQAQEFFFSDDNTDTSHRPVLTINYEQDLTAPTSGLLFNGGATATNQSTVALTPASADPGAIEEWSNNWATVNGVATANLPPNSTTPAAFSVDSAGTQLTADTSSCGGTTCWAQTFFTHTLNINNWPTFTAMFKTDTVPFFHFGVVSKDNAGTRFTLVNDFTSATALTAVQYSTSAGVISTTTTNIPFSANTWYYGQVVFPRPDVGEIYLWPVGQPRPSTPVVAMAGIYMTNPGLNFWMLGDNGAAGYLHHYSIANVNMTTKDTASGTAGYGLWGMSFSGDGATYACPAPASGIWCVYSTDGPAWTLSAGDGRKTVWYKYADNAGHTLTSSAQIVYDTMPPVVTAISPGNNREVRGIVPITVTANDPAAPDGSAAGIASAVLYVDGVQAGAPVSGSPTPTFLWDTTNLFQGAHTLTATVTDTAGNISAIGGTTQVLVATTALMPYETLSTKTLADGETTVSVNIATGGAIVSHDDLAITSRGPDLSISRTWQSLGNLSGYFGAGWSSELDVRLTPNADGSVTYRDAAGGVHVFLSAGSGGGYRTPPGLYLNLVKNADGAFTLTSRDQMRSTFSATGLLTSTADRNGNTRTITYSNGVLTTMTDAAGRQLALTVSGGHVTQISDPGLRTYGYAYDASGNLTDYTNPAGMVTHYTYDSNHRLTAVTLDATNPENVRPLETDLTYDTSNRLVQLTYMLSVEAGVSYSIQSGIIPQVQVLQLKDISTTPDTYETTTYQLTTDGMGTVAKETNPVGGTTLYQYDASGNVTQVTDPDGHVATSTYDVNGHLLTHVVDPGSGSGHLNLTTSATYDSANNVLTTTDAKGIVTQFTYDSPATGNVIQTVHHYVSGGPQSSDTNVTTMATYDAYGEVLTATDPLGVVSKLTYDSAGNVLTAIVNYVSGGPSDDHTNVTTSMTYNLVGDPLSVTNPLGTVTTFDYDALDHVTRTIINYKVNTPSDGHTNITATMSYDILGHQVTVTNPLGVVTHTDYDVDGQPVQTIANYVATGPSDTQTNVLVSRSSYDAAGNVVWTKDAKGNVTSTVYDLANRPVQVTQTNSSGTVLANSKTVYDAAGLVTESDLLDSSNVVLVKTTYTYDGAGRELTAVAPPALPGDPGAAGKSNVTTYSYDANGNTLDAKTTNAAVTGVVNESQATFDALNRALTKTEQAGTTAAQTSTLAYDAEGRTTSFTDPAGNHTSIGYDVLGRATSVTQPDGSVQTLAYDAAGQTLSSSTSAGATKDSYDSLGRVTSEERDDGAGAIQTIVTNSYDANSNVVSKVITFPGSTSTNYSWTYDKLDRPVTMSDGTRNYTYDLNGNLTAMATGNNSLQVQAGYDGLNRMTTLTDKLGTAASGWIVHNYSYTYDAFGNRKQAAEDLTTTSYTYDFLTQLTKVQQGTSTTSFTYDAFGNRATMVTSAGTTRYSYDSAGVTLQKKTDPSGKITNYTYDPKGSLTKATYDPTGVNQVTSYTYDASNRLKEVTKPTGTKITFGYDADGNRISKAVTSGATTAVTKDVYALGQLAYQTDGAGTVLATFTYDTGGMPSSVVVGAPTTGPRYFYVYNGHGDVVALTDSNGITVASYSYDAFGNVLSSSESFPGGWSNPYRYDGAEGVRYGSETSLYWMSVRAYDPTLGRFISRDPLGRLTQAGFDWQPYVYAANNPLTHTDPSGLQRCNCDGGGSTPPPPPAVPPSTSCTNPGCPSSQHPGHPPAPSSNPSHQSGGAITCSANQHSDPRCAQWEARASERRQNELEDLRHARGKNLVLAAVFFINGAFATVASALSGVDVWLEVFVEIGSVLHQMIVPGLELLVGPDAPITVAARAMTAPYEKLLVVAEALLTKWKHLSHWLQQGSKWLITAAKDAGLSAFDMVLTLVAPVLSGVMNYVGGVYLERATEAQLSLEAESKGSLVDWCNAFASGCTMVIS